MIRFSHWLAPLALIAAPAAADDRMTPAEAAAVQLAIERGQLMYAYDQAAWHGTDDMIARMKAAGSYEKLAPSVGGWVVEGSAEAPVITFFDKDERAPRAVYRATMTEGGSKVANAALPGDGRDAAVTPAQLALIKAVRAARAEALKQKIMLCNDRMPNTIVLPPKNAGEPTLVYFLTPQTDVGEFPFGGHWRFEVSTDGKIGKSRRFTKSCFTTRAPSKNERSVLMSITHSFDPTPTEIHVFTMLTSMTAVQVLTAEPKPRSWNVYRLAGQSRIELDDTLKK